jgi:cell division protein FtsL
VRFRHWFPLWAVPVLLAMAIGTVWVRLSIVGTTYEIGQADQMIRSLHQESEQMELKVTALRSPRRLEGIARAKFGLTQPRSDQVVYLSDGPLPPGPRHAENR